jgi:hypothetical protein
MTLEDVGPDLWRHCAALEVEMTLLIYPVVVGQGTRRSGVEQSPHRSRTLELETKQPARPHQDAIQRLRHSFLPGRLPLPRTL